MRKRQRKEGKYGPINAEMGQRTLRESRKKMQKIFTELLDFTEDELNEIESKSDIYIYTMQQLLKPARGDIKITVTFPHLVTTVESFRGLRKEP